MSWRLSAAAERMRKEIDALFPVRDKTSDGAKGDSAHAERVSDHNPDEDGWVRAIDVDEDVWGRGHQDPAMANVLCRKIVEIAKKDKRIKYVIFEGHIWSESFKWRKRVFQGYTHPAHIHISFNKSGDGDGSPFGLVDELREQVVVARKAVTKKAVVS